MRYIGASNQAFVELCETGEAGESPRRRKSDRHYLVRPSSLSQGSGYDVSRDDSNAGKNVECSSLAIRVQD